MAKEVFLKFQDIPGFKSVPTNGYNIKI